MDHSMSPDEQEQEKCVQGHSLGHLKAKSWDADHLAADHEKEHHSDNEHFDKREQRKRLDVLVARNRRKRTNGDIEDADPFHASTQRKWESKHKRQDHRRQLRRSIWHPTGRIAGPSAAEEARNVVDHQARLDGVVERLFHYDSSDEERLETTREYRMMKRRREAMQELLDFKKLRDLWEREERSTAAVVPEPKRFKGWKDRMVHAEKVLHSKHEPDHGYYRELYYALRADQPGSQERRAVYGEPGLDGEEEVDAESSFLWPPVLLVNNAAAHKVEDGREKTGTLTEVRAVFSGRHNKENVVVYPATEVGFVDALRLSKKLEACHADPEKLIRVDHRRYRTLVDPHEDDGLSSSDDSAYSRREAELPGNRSKKCHETNVRLIKRKGGDGKNLHWRLKNPQECVDVDPVKGLCEKWSNTFTLTQGPPAEVHPWKLTEKVFHFLSMSPSEENPADTHVQSAFSRGLQKHSTDVDEDRLGMTYLLTAAMVDMQRQADLRFKEQLQQTRLQSASSKKKLGNELKAIEHEMRRDKLLWLQELETVRDRFADMADDMKDNESKRELDQVIRAMQLQQEYEQKYQAKADEVDRQNAERFDRDLLFLQNKKRSETKVEGQALVKEWTAEEKTLEGEVVEARRTRKQMRRRLQQKLLDRRNQHMANLGHRVDSDIVHHSDYLNVDEQPLEIAGIVNDVKGF